MILEMQYIRCNEALYLFSSLHSFACFSKLFFQWVQAFPKRAGEEQNELPGS